MSNGKRQVDIDTLYERMNGDEIFDPAVDLFYEKVLGDQILAPFFKDVNMKRQRIHQKRFLTYAFGGLPDFDHDYLKTSHAHLVRDQGLNSEYFDIMMGHLKDALLELGVEAEITEEVATLLEDTRAPILGQ